MISLSEDQRRRRHCEHVAGVDSVEPGSAGCADCQQRGDWWVHLRVCMTCGHVGCCDSSPNRHATAHYHATRHAIVRSFEAGEDWAWCYAHRLLL
jgi:uncharacterized UBP type Zn finger protein